MDYTVVVPVAASTVELPDVVHDEEAVVAALPASAVVAAVFPVSAAAVVVATKNETISDSKPIHKDVTEEDHINDHLFGAIRQKHAAGEQSVLESIMSTTKVSLERSICIESLDDLVTRLKRGGNSSVSPGFDCINTALPWDKIAVFPQYETLHTVNALKGIIPLPSPVSAISLFELVRLVWQKRLDFEACNTNEERESYCSCIGHWRQNQNILRHLCNQVLEQMMAMEASTCLRKQPANFSTTWNDAYSPDKCPHPATMDCLYIDSFVHLLTSDTYLQSYIDAALSATSTIDVSVCYLFHTDPQTKYILLDLLPYVARRRGVKVRVIFELAILESQVLQMPLDEFNCDLKLPLHLPKGCPEYIHGARKFRSATEIVREFFSITSDLNIEAKYWFARDKACGYRIKNHGKWHIFDGNSQKGRVIAGGSNVAPRPGSLDTDFVVHGEVAGMYLAHFESIWTAMTSRTVGRVIKIEEKKECEDEHIVESLEMEQCELATSSIVGHKARVLFLPSTPSSSGEDVILRCVLGAINCASESIYMCMGHLAVSEVVARAFRSATDRGVKVQIISNSLHSCDLRTGQTDLMRSLKMMLTVAPKVQLFVAAVKDGNAPPFLHSKYVVVDSKWSCSGSWNLWTRSAFYEMEAEVFVQSECFASDLEEKFHRERGKFCIPVTTADECEQFLPKGCAICEGFGPFFKQV